MKLRLPFQTSLSSTTVVAAAAAAVVGLATPATPAEEGANTHRQAPDSLSSLLGGGTTRDEFVPSKITNGRHRSEDAEALFEGIDDYDIGHSLFLDDNLHNRARPRKKEARLRNQETTTATRRLSSTEAKEESETEDLGIPGGGGHNRARAREKAAPLRNQETTTTTRRLPSTEAKEESETEDLGILGGGGGGHRPSSLARSPDPSRKNRRRTASNSCDDVCPPGTATRYTVPATRNLNKLIASCATDPPGDDCPGPIECFDTSQVENMDQAFRNNARSWNEPLDCWDVSSVTSMAEMFYNADEFNQPLDHWETGEVRNMRKMFDSANSFNQDIESWDVSNVLTMQGMFFQATSFNKPLDEWKVQSVTNFSNMFAETNFDQCLSTWGSKVTGNTNCMFYDSGCSGQPTFSCDVLAADGPWCAEASATCYSQTDSPTQSPTKIQPGACQPAFGGENGAYYFELRTQLQNPSEYFEWKIFDPVDNVEWKGDTDFTIGGNIKTYSTLSWNLCLPVAKCWTLSVSNTNVNFVKAYFDGIEVFSLFEDDISDDIELCIGRNGGHCKDPGGKFKYRRPGKRDKRIGCQGVGDEKGRKRKKICDSGCVGDVCRKVKQRCLESCGKVGRGECDFLKDFDGTPSDTPPGSNKVRGVIFN